ncbi:MAG: histidine kinase dimerization/phospho-acceptor domain-containing protein, partial [Elusimicrobiaceae bacterium]|nr:histidine kinase dimerization/phospho-acceptor domain-containing protein [Elusimicrobiaceae bacterium]
MITRKKIPNFTMFTVPNQSLRYRKEFHNGISHALRSPLVGAMGYVEYLFKGYAGELEPEQMSQLALARESIMRLTGTIDAILDAIAFDLRIVKPGAGKCVAQEQIGLIGKELRDVFRQKKVRLEINMPKAPLVCRMEGHWLQSMIYEMAAAALRLASKNSAAELSVKKPKNRCRSELNAEITPETATPAYEIATLFAPFRLANERDTS